jgi:hypothetical protein
MSDMIPPLIAEICEAADVKIGGTLSLGLSYP